MLKLNLQTGLANLKDIYNTKDEYALGRVLSLAISMVNTFYNVFMTGIFYTGFLSMYDISITQFGIIAFFPSIATFVFGLLSPLLMERIKKRKWVLIGVKLTSYLISVLAITLMPTFVTDPNARVIWFALLSFIAQALQALIAPASSLFFYVFYPKENKRRSNFVLFQMVFTSSLSSIVLLTSSILTDAVAGSPYQQQLILGFRFFSLLLAFTDLTLTSFVKEYPYPATERVRFKQLFSLPFTKRKFLLCSILGLISSFGGGLIATQSHHLLNHVRLSYTYINSMSVLYTIILVLLSTTWGKIRARFSWIKTYGICMLAVSPTYILYFFLSSSNIWLYAVICIWQHIINVGLNLVNSNMVYMNLPEENSTVYLSFNSVMSSLCSLIGQFIGTAISDISGDSTMIVFGMEIYSVQFTFLMHGIILMTLGLVAFFNWRSFSNEQSIAEVEGRIASKRNKKASLAS